MLNTADRKYFSASFYSTLSVIFKVLLAFFISLWVARELGPAKYGLSAILTVYATLIISISSEGLRLAILKKNISVLLEIKKPLFYVFINSFIGLFFVLVFYFYLLENELSSKTLYLILIIPFLSLYPCLTAIDQVKDRFGILTIKQVLSSCIGVLVGVVNHLLYEDINTLLIFLIFNYLAFIIISISLDYKEYKKFLSNKLNYKNQIDGKWIYKGSGVGAMGIISNQAPMIIGQIWMSREAFGLFSLGWRIFEASFRNIVAIFTSVFSPAIAQEKHSYKKYIILDNFSIILMIAVSCIATIIMLYFPWLQENLLGNDWKGVNNIISFMCLFMLVLAPSSLLTQFIIFNKGISIALYINGFKLFIYLFILPIILSKNNDFYYSLLALLFFETIFFVIVAYEKKYFLNFIINLCIFLLASSLILMLSNWIIKIFTYINIFSFSINILVLLILFISTSYIFINRIYKSRLIDD